MQPPELVCSRCGQTAKPGTKYCANCGEAVDPALVTELRDLYVVLGALDAQVTVGQGERTVVSLRDEMQKTYLRLRQPQTGLPIGSVRAAPSAGWAARAPGDAALAATPAVVTPGAAIPAPAKPQRPPRPAFSWQAFLSEQAIAIMAYLGAFLLLVATLAFELGGWQGLSAGIKLALVLVVYVAFGALGFGLRRVRDLRTVSSAYLGIFALMTPLVVLALYRFVLQASGFPVAGMICLGALYAAIVYLALALRTDFAVYAYLGWLSSGVALVAMLAWAAVPQGLATFGLAIFALALLFPARLRRWEVAARLGVPARLVSLLPGAWALVMIALYVIENLVTVFMGEPAQPSATALLTASMLVALGVGWSATARASLPRSVALAAASDIAVAALAAQAAIVAALQFGASRTAMVEVIVVAALAAMAAVAWYRRVAPTLAAQRRGLEVIALALIGVGYLMPHLDGGVDWALIGLLTAGMIVAVGIALAEDARWWLLLAGVFLTLDYQTIGRAILPPSRIAQDSSPFYAVLTLAIWALALGLGQPARTRRFALPVYVVALGEAGFTSVLVWFNPSADTQTIILLLFAILAFVAARLERQPLVGGLVVGLFGVLASLPWLLEGGANSLKGALLALALGVVALVTRRALGRPWALPLYVAGLVSVALAVVGSDSPEAVTAHWVVLDAPFATWLLLIAAVIASVIALVEDYPWATAAPAALGLWAVITTGDHLIAGTFPFIYAAVGAALRRRRGAWWGVPWYGAAFFASWLVLVGLPELGAWGEAARAPVAVVLGAVAYAVAREERQPYATAATALFLVYAAWWMPGPYDVALNIALTVAVVAAGFALGRLLERRWAMGLYAAAALVSLFAVGRAYALGTGQGEALLLVFAALAYVVAQLEREWRAGVVAVLYGAAAVFVRPDAHALLPLAVVCAVLGVGAGRLGGFRFSYPLYAVAAVGGVVTAFTGSREPGFEAIALGVMALLVYAIAAIESRPDALAVALLLGALATGAAASALDFAAWQAVLAFAGLAWLYALGRYLWGVLPGLRPRGAAWWASAVHDAQVAQRLADPRALGIRVHRWAGLLVGAGAVAGGMLAPDAFTPHASQTAVLGVTLLSLAGILAVLGRETGFRLAMYGAGGLVALAITLAVRWLGAENAQAFILAPGSYLMLCGALVPADEAVEHGEGWGAGASLLGSLLLLTVTTAQSFQSDADWIYAVVLAVEALVIAGLGLGMRSRPLIVVGSAFVVLAALRGSIVALSSGVPVAVVLALASLLVLGAATWLSLRARRGTSGEGRKPQS